MNIYQRINAIKKEVNYIKKDTEVSGFGNKSYKALSHDMVTAMTRELFIKYGVVCVPTLMNKSFTEGIVLDNKQKQGRFDCTYRFKFICDDDPTSSMDSDIASQGMDTQDKAPGKALSMAKKLAILKILDIESGDAEESRFKEEIEFDLDAELNILSICETADSLREQYMKSIALASKLSPNKFKEVKNHIIAAKDDRKKELGV